MIIFSSTNNVTPPPGTMDAVSITAADFTGSDYTNPSLVNQTPVTNFSVFSNDGSGALLKEGKAYTFNTVTGTLTMTPGNYTIFIYPS
jgi:hypothetical protein